MFDNDELVREFLVESAENVDQLDRDFVVLEQDPADTEVLSRIFRAVHTIKGTCGFFGFQKLESVTHAGENLLSKLRDLELRLTPAITSALLQMVDAIREMLASIEQSGTEGNADYDILVRTLARLQGAPSPAPDAPSARIPQHAQAAACEAEAETAPISKDEVVFAANAAESKPVQAIKANTLSEASPSQEPQSSPEPLCATGMELAAAEGGDAALDGAVKPRESSGVTDSTIRVDVNLLDKLMNMVGELVLARNQTIQIVSGIEDSNLTAATQRLNLITTELQEAVMKTRMQPIGNVWNKFPRVVRDLSVTLGKRIRIEMEGQDTELDKTILEAIKDPLTHIVRNSVDHGIEAPEVRAAAGKPEEGLLQLRAFHEGGQVIIEIRDDGAGVNTQRVAQKAAERGLVSRDKIAHMNERDINNLIFLPGFSTAEQVTNISGRGVGMDVVKTNIEKIGGTVDLHSQQGKGSTLRIKIPLTLAIVPALIVNCRGERYAIPQVSLLELVRIEGEEAAASIEMIHGSPVYRLRGALLPLVRLDELLELEHTGCTLSNTNRQALNIVVLQTEERPFGLVVDGIQDTEEIVVKPLGKQIQHISVFAGAAVMGDGRVALILDVVGIAQAAGVLAENRRRTLPETDGPVASETALCQPVLLFQAGEGGRFAIPLSMVARLEEFNPAAVEHAGDQDVVQYRGQILPLVRVARHLQSGRKADLSAPPAEDGKLQVVVCARNGHSVGLAVDRILDITEEGVTAKGPASQAGVLHTAVIQGRVTELLDVDAFVRVAVPAYFEDGALAGKGF